MDRKKDQLLADEIAKLSLGQEAQEKSMAKDNSKTTKNTPSNTTDTSSTPGANRRSAAGYIPPHRREKQDTSKQAIGTPHSLSTLLLSTAGGCLTISSR